MVILFVLVQVKRENLDSSDKDHFACSSVLNILKLYGDFLHFIEVLKALEGMLRKYLH